MRRSTAIVAVLLLSLPPAGRAQEPPPPGGSEPAPPASGVGLAGSWTGWAKLANDGPGQACRYDSPPESTAVRLEFSSDGGVLKGSIAIDVPPGEGSGCPPLRKRYTVAEVIVGEGTVSFSDSGGNEWNLSLRRGGSVLQGLLAWRQGGPEEPLGEGFALPDGTKPAARLSGEVRLRKAAAEGTADAAEAASAKKKSAGAGQHAKNLGLVLGANVVGLGLLYGVNKIGKGTSSSGVLTCSPRNCIVGAPGQPCFCEGNVVSGASCGSTTAGVAVGGTCNGQGLPCQSTLSCNSGICEDRFGRCPY